MCSLCRRREFCSCTLSSSPSHDRWKKTRKPNGVASYRKSVALRHIAVGCWLKLCQQDPLLTSRSCVCMCVVNSVYVYVYSDMYMYMYFWFCMWILCVSCWMLLFHGTDVCVYCAVLVWYVGGNLLQYASCATIGLCGSHLKRRSWTTSTTMSIHRSKWAVKDQNELLLPQWMQMKKPKTYRRWTSDIKYHVRDGVCGCSP